MSELNKGLSNFTPPLPPKLRQIAPPIPPKLNKIKEKSVKKIFSNSEQKNKKTKNNSIVQNESYRFFENLDYVKKDNEFIYENRNIILKDTDIKEKPKSIISKMKKLFTKKSKKVPIEFKDNEYFSSHKSEGSIFPSRINRLIETSEDSCTCSELNKSWYTETQDACCCSRGPSNIRFHIIKQHCHFNCLPMCQMNNPCHCCQLEHLSRINSQFYNINRCVNCQPCVCNTHCHSRVSSFSMCSKVAQFNHDLPLLDNNRVDTVESNTDNFDIQPITVMPVRHIFTQETNTLTMSLHENIQLLRKAGWYWGPLKLDEAEEIMKDMCDGTFIVRDSSHADYFFSITFRVNNITHHTRIQFSQKKFCLNQDVTSDGFKTVVDLINATVIKSQDGQFRYFQSIDNPSLPTYAVILLYPLSRFRIMTSLKHIARFVIVSHVRSDHLDQLPLPEYLVSYLQDKDHHYVENFHNYVNIMKMTDLS